MRAWKSNWCPRLQQPVSAEIDFLYYFRTPSAPIEIYTARRALERTNWRVRRYLAKCRRSILWMTGRERALFVWPQRARRSRVSFRNLWNESQFNKWCLPPVRLSFSCLDLPAKMKISGKNERPRCGRFGTLILLTTPAPVYWKPTDLRGVIFSNGTRQNAKAEVPLSINIWNECECFYHFIPTSFSNPWKKVSTGSAPFKRYVGRNVANSLNDNIKVNYNPLMLCD